MKEELIRVLNKKLDNIKSDIDSLNDLNGKIDEENEKLDFVKKIISIFKENGENNPLNFDKIDKEDFTRVLDLTGEDVKNLFSNSSCNYDGLVYLINGIKNGVSITLTNEQTNGIEYLIQSLGNKKNETENKIQEYNQEKSKYEISDVSELKNKKEDYEDVIGEVNKNEYVKNVDLLKEAIGFAELSPNETIDILSYTLEYNANLYKENKPVVKEEKKEEKKEDEYLDREEKEEKEETVKFEEEKKDDDFNEFHFNQIENDNLFELPNITFDEEEKVEEPEEEKKDEVEEDKKEDDYLEKEEEKKEEVEDTSKEEDNIIKPEPFTFTSYDNNEQSFSSYDDKEDSFNDIPYVPLEEEKVEEPKEEKQEEVEQVDESLVGLPTNEEDSIEKDEEVKVEEPVVDDDFKDVVNEKHDYEEPDKEEKTTSTRELHKIFSKYGIEENVVLNELVDGDVKEYQNVLDALKDRDILDSIKKNKELLIEMLLYSNTEVIDKILKIIKEDLSVDDEDYDITRKIVINTIPSIFIREGGNYDNFIKNVELFKNLEINLINLFDFSKEIFVADNESIKKNLDIVNKYGFDIDYKNAKYLLLIPNIEEKLDYYIESVYEDKTKNETFDGIKYIKEYAAKLNVVTDETIKRLRYASSNGQKVFGNKPGSLSGEITNLKVHALAISDEYMNSFFNNEFTNITNDEVREYVKLIHNSSNVGDYSDELDKLNSYHDGLRYNIEGINVSYNKVARNYSVLRSYGIDPVKALHFAVCYNLVITKDEYNKLKDLLSKVGGNV